MIIFTVELQNSGVELFITTVSNQRQKTDVNPIYCIKIVSKKIDIKIRTKPFIYILRDFKNAYKKNFDFYNI